MLNGMFKAMLKRQTEKFGRHYNYDISYLLKAIEVSPGAVAKLARIQAMSGHREAIPAEPWFAAKLRTVLAEDCGPCTQLAVDMALEAGVDPAHVEYIVQRKLDLLPADTALVIRFTEYVLARDMAADALREQIIGRWGEAAVISLAMAISATRVYPTVKYVLGHGMACSRIQVRRDTISPVHAQPLAEDAA